MKKFIVMCIIGLLLVTLSGCDSMSYGGWFGGGINAVQGRGDMVARNFDTASFNGIIVSGGYVVVYRQAETPAVTVQMQENLFEYLSVSVENGILRIESDRSFRTDRGYTPRVYVYAPYLSNLTVAGAATLENWDTVYTTRLDINISGAANGLVYVQVDDLRIDTAGAAGISLAGTADTARITVAGAGDIDASELQTRTAQVNISGAGNVEIAVSDTLDATINGVGNIWYIGSPQVNRTVAGVGRVRER